MKTIIFVNIQLNSPISQTYNEINQYETKINVPSDIRFQIKVCTFWFLSSVYKKTVSKQPSLCQIINNEIDHWWASKHRIEIYFLLWFIHGVITGLRSYILITLPRLGIWHFGNRILKGLEKRQYCKFVCKKSENLSIPENFRTVWKVTDNQGRAGVYHYS